MHSIFIAILVTLLTTGCSSVQLAYNSADFFVERYADAYLGLDGAQMRHWSPVLEAAPKMPLAAPGSAANVMWTICAGGSVT